MLVEGIAWTKEFKRNETTNKIVENEPPEEKSEICIQQRLEKLNRLINSEKYKISLDVNFCKVISSDDDDDDDSRMWEYFQMRMRQIDPTSAAAVAGQVKRTFVIEKDDGGTHNLTVDVIYYLSPSTLIFSENYFDDIVKFLCKTSHENYQQLQHSLNPFTQRLQKEMASEKNIQKAKALVLMYKARCNISTGMEVDGRVVISLSSDSLEMEIEFDNWSD